LQLNQGRAHHSDIEKGTAKVLGIGSKDFPAFLAEHTRELLGSKTLMLEAWNSWHASASRSSAAEKLAKDDNARGGQGMERQDERMQLYLLLYADFLVWSIARRVLALVLFADEIKASRELRTQLIVPPYNNCKDFLVNRSGKKSAANAEKGRISTPPGHSPLNVEIGRDATHLPPTNLWERYSTHLRAMPNFLQSLPTAFALRVTAATLCIAIVGFLASTQAFYIKQHLTWAQYAVSFCMQTSSGQSVRHLFYRFLGTVLAVSFALTSWYIVDHHAAGALVFYWIFLHVPMYIMVWLPRYQTAGTVSAFALTIVLGEQLQLQKIGFAKAEQEGQAVHPMWLLGLTRLAAVSAGLFVAWFWTVFPYPVSEHDELRKTLASCIGSLTRYYALMQETVQRRLRGEEGWSEPGLEQKKRVERHRAELATQCSAHLRTMRGHLKALKWDIRLGCKFPVKQYERAITSVEALLGFTELCMAASTMLLEFLCAENDSLDLDWLTRFQGVLDSGEAERTAIITLLTLLFGSIKTSTPLPPYLKVQRPSALAGTLAGEERNDLLDVRYVAEPGHATLVVLRIGTQCFLERSASTMSWRSC
jgi:hypothetical protein